MEFYIITALQVLPLLRQTERFPPAYGSIFVPARHWAGGINLKEKKTIQKIEYIWKIIIIESTDTRSWIHREINSCIHSVIQLRWRWIIELFDSQARQIFDNLNVKRMVAQAKPIEGRDGGNSLVVEDGEFTYFFVKSVIFWLLLNSPSRSGNMILICSSSGGLHMPSVRIAAHTYYQHLLIGDGVGNNYGELRTLFQARTRCSGWACTCGMGWTSRFTRGEH